MKYKIQSACDKQSLLHLTEGKYDWVLWSGVNRDQCVQIAGLFRTMPKYKFIEAMEENNEFIWH